MRVADEDVLAFVDPARLGHEPASLDLAGGRP
jgi:hypothetical protein